MNEDEFYKRLAQAMGERDQAMRDYLEACRARDEAQRALSGEAAHIKSLEGLLVDALRERDALHGAMTVRYSLSREIEEIFGVTGADASDEQLALGVAAARRIVRERDEAQAELAKTSADFSSVWESRDTVIEERERARQACNAYWHDLTRIALLCAQTDDEYPLKAVERTVREFAQSRRDFVRVADALGLVGTDDTGRIGAIASVEDIVAQARLAARALSREQPEPEEER